MYAISRTIIRCFYIFTHPSITWPSHDCHMVEGREWEDEGKRGEISLGEREVAAGRGQEEAGDREEETERWIGDYTKGDTGVSVVCVLLIALVVVFFRFFREFHIFSVLYWCNGSWIYKRRLQLYTPFGCVTSIFVHVTFPFTSTYNTNQQPIQYHPLLWSSGVCVCVCVCVCYHVFCHHAQQAVH